jgi:hypothetical protein
MGAEPKLRSVRVMLNVYRNIYLPNPQLRGKRLLDEALRYYQLPRRKLPDPLQRVSGEDNIRVMRNLRRYIQQAERIIRNVAKGDFPGKY